MKPKELSGEDMLKLQTIFHNQNLVVAVADIKVCIAGYRFRKYLDFPYRLDNCIDE